MDGYNAMDKYAGTATLTLSLDDVRGFIDACTDPHALNDISDRVEATRARLLEALERPKATRAPRKSAEQKAAEAKAGEGSAPRIVGIE